MIPRTLIFIMAPQMLFTLNEIMDAEDRLEGFARVIHTNEDVEVSKPEKYINPGLTALENGKILANIISKISEEEPDEIYLCNNAWDCREIRVVEEFARIAGIRVIDFDLENVIPNGHRLMYMRQNKDENACKPANVAIGE